MATPASARQDGIRHDPRRRVTPGRIRDLDTIDSELRLAALQRAARDHGERLPSIRVADALLDERRDWPGASRTVGPGRLAP